MPENFEWGEKFRHLSGHICFSIHPSIYGPDMVDIHWTEEGGVSHSVDYTLVAAERYFQNGTWIKIKDKPKVEIVRETRKENKEMNKEINLILSRKEAQSVQTILDMHIDMMAGGMLQDMSDNDKAFDDSLNRTFNALSVEERLKSLLNV